MQSFFNNSLIIIFNTYSNFKFSFHLDKEFLPFPYHEKKKKFTKQTTGNKPKIKHVTDYSSCKIKYFSAYLVQSIVIKFILPLSRKNCTKRKFHQTKICFTRSFSSITNAHTHTRAHIFYILSFTAYSTTTRIKFFYPRSRSGIRYHRYLLCAHRSLVSDPPIAMRACKHFAGKARKLHGRASEISRLLFSCKHIYRPRSRFSHVNSARVTSAPIKPACVVILPRSKLAPIDLTVA